jgi:cytochrome c nitrite reductase small subunit
MNESAPVVPTKLRFLLAAGLGVAAGLGLFTFSYAEGASYLSDDPKACINCHVMRDVYETWLRSSHHRVATCNDCHTPHTFTGKWLTKARNGWNHSYAFTIGDFPDPIVITPPNARVLEEACVSCHAPVVAEVEPPLRAEAQRRCVVCHRTVGHGGTFATRS